MQVKVSLVWQVLWAPALALGVAAALLAAEVSARARLTQRIAEVTTMRESLERAFARLDERHERTVRRANEAVLEPHREARRAILAWTTQHYVKEMERYVGEARSTIAAVHPARADTRLAADLERLQGLVGRILDQTHRIAPVLDALISAALSEDPDAILNATQELERADRTMENLLRTAYAMVRRTAAWQLDRALDAPPPVPRVAWVLLLLWVPSSLYLARRPLGRLRRLLAGEPVRTASPEEAVLAQRLRDLEVEHEGLVRSHAERTREAERTATANRRLEHELALLRLYNENLVNSLRAAIVVTDAGLRLRSFNRAARVLFSLSEEAVDGLLSEQPLFGALAHEARDSREELLQAISERRILRYESLPFASAQGEILLDLTVAPYMDESGAARGLILVADDVTDAVRTKNQLLMAERLAAVGRLSAQVAHEIRNPLSAIGLNAELLGDEFARDLPEPRRSEAARLLSAIAAEVERLTEVTEGYLRLTRLPRPNLRCVDLNQLVSDLTSMLREEMKTHGVTVRLELASPAPLASVDPGQVRQALLNVLRNSREAMPEGGSLRLATSAEDGAVSVAVTDTGSGIPEEVLPRVFEPFFSTKVAGTGLGLSLTRQIVAEHGGHIRVESNATGGARVTMTLPAAGAEPRLAGPPAEPEEDIG
jgi:PAS domain S-box-containing protein